MSVEDEIDELPLEQLSTIPDSDLEYARKSNHLVESTKDQNFASVALENCNDFYVGTTTHYNAPVTIHQIVEQSMNSKINESENLIESLRCKKQLKAYILVAATITLIASSLIFLSFVSMPRKSDDESNLRIIERNEWNANEPESIWDLPLNQELPVKNIIITATGQESCFDEIDCKKKVKEFEKTFLGNQTIGHHWIIGGIVVFKGRNWDQRPSCSKCYNSIVISLIGDFRQTKPTQYQLKATNLIIKSGVIQEFIAQDYLLCGKDHYTGRSGNSSEDHLFEILKTWPHWIKNECLLRGFGH